MPAATDNNNVFKLYSFISLWIIYVVILCLTIHCFIYVIQYCQWPVAGDCSVDSVTVEVQYFFHYEVNKVSFGQGGRILMMQLLPLSSITTFMNTLIENLAPQHQITAYSVVNHNIIHPNFTTFPLEIPKINIFDFNNMYDDMNRFNQFSVINKQAHPLTDEYIREIFRINKNLQDLITSKEKFDLFFIYLYISEHFLLFAPILQSSVVLVHSSLAYPSYNDVIDNPNFLSYECNGVFRGSNDYLFNRLKNYIMNALILFIHNWWYIPNIDKVCREIFPPGTPPLYDIYKNVSLVLLNTHEAMGYSRPMLSNSVEIGGLHCTSNKPLAPDLEEFIAGAGEHGIIYFSLGTTVHVNFPSHILRIIINSFEKLPQRIIWKNNLVIKDLPQNIKMSNWFPQQDILGHNKTKLFISHGGMLSLIEAVCHGVPVLGIPITFDQPSNIYLAQKVGYARHINLMEITEEKFIAEINELLLNKQYKEKVMTTSKLLKDQPLSSADKLIWWTDFLIRHKGLPFYRPGDNRYAPHNIIETDMLALIIILLCIICIIIKIIVNNVIYFVKKYKHAKLKIKKL